MKRYLKNVVATLLLVVFLLSSYLPTVAVGSQPTTYSKSSNSGTRGVVCTDLNNTSAESYYTGDYEITTLVDLSSSALLTSLRALMTDTHTKKTTTYDNCRDMVWIVDCEQNDTSHATTLYSDYSMNTGDWYPTWACNREHVWPQSLGGGNTSGGGADLHHIRPEKQGINSSRGNKPFGYASGHYEPEDYAKGDVARIILYVWVRWGTAWGADSVTEVFQSVDVLLEWCALDPVDTWEMGRNEVVQNIQGNRNVFIDYPELAWLLFDEEVPADMTTPSGLADDIGTGTIGGGNNGGNNGGTTGGNTGNVTIPDAMTETEKILILLTLGASNSIVLNHISN